MKSRNIEMFKSDEQLSHFLAERREVLFAYRHGSSLDQEYFNDIDVAVFLEKKTLVSLDACEYETSLSLALQKKIGYSVDVKILNRAPLSFRYQATKGILLFSKDEAARENFLCRTWMEYFDFQPAAKIYLKESLRA